MAFDVGAGLSSMGAAIATTAGAATLEAQKAGLEQEKVKLADELAGKREEKQRGFLTSEREAGQTFQSGEKVLDRTSEEKRAQLQAAAHLGAADIHRDATLKAEKMRSDVQREALTPAEVRTAQWFSKATPDEKAAFQDALLAKAGMPAWATGGGPAATAKPPGGPPSTPSPVGEKEAGKPGSGNFNEEALGSAPPAAVATVKAMVDGRMAPPTSFAMAKPYWQAHMALAQAYDPTFDQTTWASRVATRKDFTAGKSAQAVTALNTALGHAGVLTDSFDKLDNRGGVLTPLNSILNPIGRAFGDDRVTNAQMAVSALSSEARKVFAASGGGSLTELESWEKNFPINGSPDQQKGAMKQFVHLLDSRLESLSDQYNRGMGRTDDPLKLLEPRAREVFEKLSGKPPDSSTGYQMGNSRTPTAPTSPAESTGALPPVEKRAIGRTYQTPRGPYIWMGNGWAPAPPQEGP